MFLGGLSVTRYNAPMIELIRIIKHEAVPKTGSFEVRFADGRESPYFYWDDPAARSLERTNRINAKWV